MTRVRFLPVGPVRCGSQAWNVPGVRHLTVVVKAALALDTPGWLDDPDPICERDLHEDKNPTRSLADASDLAPYLGRGEVLFRGAAYVPRGVPTPARLALLRGAALVDKRVIVHGSGPGRLARVPVVWEQALGGPGHPRNPVGRADPAIVHPDDPSVPAGLGPIARSWRARAELLGLDQRKSMQSRTLQLADGFPWEYFHAAPADQRAPALFHGDEVLVLERLTADGGCIELTLPGARAEARVLRPAAPPQMLALVLDTIRVDGERRRCTLSWRGNLTVADGDVSLVVVAGVAGRGEAIAWPAVEHFEEPAAPSPVAIASASLNETRDVHLKGLAAPTLPFARRPQAEPSAARVQPPIPDAPWSPRGEVAAPKPVPPPAPRAAEAAVEPERRPAAITRLAERLRRAGAGADDIAALHGALVLRTDDDGN
jgi:hypothetical protein